MSKATREVWHCDLCGWEWLPDTNKVPERCPNRSCRKRNWNQPEAAIAYEPIVQGKDVVGFKIKHDPTCKCLTCKPPKSSQQEPRSSS